MATETNQAAWFDGKGTKFRVAEADIPTPGSGEIVVRNRAVAVNPVDWKIQDRGLFIKTFPMVLGCDLAGDVVAVGEGVTRFKVGDRAFGHAHSLATQKPKHGGFQLYSAIPAVAASTIPQSVSYAEASVLPLAIDTAGHGLYSPREQGFLGLNYPSLEPKNTNRTIVVWGGASSVGATAIQLATASGAEVVAVASQRNHLFVKKLGAVDAFDYASETVVEDVVKTVKATGGEYFGIYDAIATQDSYQHVLKIAEQLGGNNLAVVMEGPKTVPEGVKVGNVFAASQKVNVPLWTDYVTQALEQGKLKPVPEPMIVGKGLEYVQKGVDANKAGVSAKKVVVEL